MNEHHVTLANEAGFNAWTERVGANIAVRVKHEGKIHTFLSFSQLKNWMNSVK